MWQIGLSHVLLFFLFMSHVCLPTRVSPWPPLPPLSPLPGSTLCNHSSVRSLWGMTVAFFYYYIFSLPPLTLLSTDISSENKDGIFVLFWLNSNQSVRLVNLCYTDRTPGPEWKAFCWSSSVLELKATGLRFGSWRRLQWPLVQALKRTMTWMTESLHPIDHLHLSDSGFLSLWFVHYNKNTQSHCVNTLSSFYYYILFWFALAASNQHYFPNNL